MISSLIESLLESIDKILSEGRISWGAVITALLFFNKINKYKEFRARDKRVELRQLRIESKIDDLMKDQGVASTWNLQENGSSQGDLTRLKKLYLSLHKVIIRGRKRLMQKMKSRKLWLAIFGALFPVLNVELGINLDPDMVFGVIAVVISGIAGLAHVDGKKAQAVVTALKTAVVVDPNAKYRDLFPTIKEVHSKINEFLKLAEKNDANILAVYPQILELIHSFEYPEPVANVATLDEEQVSA